MDKHKLIGMEFMPFTTDDLHRVLLTLGRNPLPEPYISNWCEESPSYGYCQFVSKAIVQYMRHIKPNMYFIPSLHHYFVKSAHGIIDLTCDQFDAGTKIDYSECVYKFTTFTKRVDFPSNIIAGSLGLYVISDEHGESQNVAA